MAVPVVIDISTQPTEAPGTGAEVEIVVRLDGRVRDKSGQIVQMSQRGKGSLKGLPATVTVPHGEIEVCVNATRGAPGRCDLIATNGVQPEPAEHTIDVR